MKLKKALGQQRGGVEVEQVFDVDSEHWGRDHFTKETTLELQDLTAEDERKVAVLCILNDEDYDGHGVEGVGGRHSTWGGGPYRFWFEVA